MRARGSSAAPAQSQEYAEPPLKISGDASRYDHRAGNDDYTQAGNLFRLFDGEQKQRLFNNIAEAMQGVPGVILGRQLAHFAKADPAYAQGVRNALEKTHADSGNLADVITLSFDEQSARPAQPHATG